MDKILKIAKKNNIHVIEDAAQGFLSKYKSKYLGSIGDIGCFSFHETKKYMRRRRSNINQQPKIC